MATTLRTFTHFPAPAHAPRRDYSYYTEEPSITRVARALGFEPMPYQRHIWAIGTEYRRDSRGRRVYHYNDVLVSTPRQSGKTTLLRPLRVYRMVINPATHLFCTAQTQKHASKRMLDMVDAVDHSIIGPLFHPRRGKGDAGLTLTCNGADLAQFTPNEEAVHGETTPYVDLDEIWNFTADQGRAIMGGIRPAQITLHGQAQRWYTSTKGTAASTFMNGMVGASLKGETPRLAYFSWEMAEGADPYDPAVWWSFHPALGNTITEEALRDEIDLPRGEWLRAYCNRLTEVAATLMPLEDWDLLAEDFPKLAPPALEDVTVGFDLAAGNECAAVVASWTTPTGRPVGKLLHQAPGTGWVKDYLEDLTARGVKVFAADSKGPAARLVDALADQLPVNAQIRRRNGVDLFDRDRSTAPIPSLIALSIGIYAHTHQVAEVTPLIVA